MKPTVETSHSMKSHELLNKVFHVLLAPSMYTELKDLSIGSRVSIGAIVRVAIEEYIRKSKVEKLLAHSLRAS